MKSWVFNYENISLNLSVKLFQNKIITWNDILVILFKFKFNLISSTLFSFKSTYTNISTSPNYKPLIQSTKFQLVTKIKPKKHIPTSLLFHAPFNGRKIPKLLHRSSSPLRTHRCYVLIILLRWKRTRLRRVRCKETLIVLQHIWIHLLQLTAIQPHVLSRWLFFPAYQIPSSSIYNFINLLCCIWTDIWEWGEVGVSEKMAQE